MTTVRKPDMVRPRGSLRRRMFVGLGVAALLIFLAVGFFLGQLVVLRSAVLKMDEETERLALALDTARQASGLLLTAQRVTETQNPERFAQELSPVLERLIAGQDKMGAEVQTLPEGDPLREQAMRAFRSLQNVVNTSREMIRLAEEENWVAVQARSIPLAASREQVDQVVDALTAEARSRYVGAEAQMDRAVQRMLSVPMLLVMVALIIGTTVTVVTVRGITVGIDQLGQSARRLAEGHFDERAPVTRDDELGQLAYAFNTMAGELQGLYGSLERQVVERTAALARRSAQLEASAQVARQAAAIRDVGQLLDETVRLISDQFGFYHAGIFLLDEAREYAVLRAASSEGGQRMLARSHKLRVGEVGIVGFVAGSGQSRVALDVGADAVYFDNPDLPQTRSEMGLPLKVRDAVIGVLDVQSTEEAAFSEEDVAVLQTMADQVALAIENARLLEQSQRALWELEALYGRRARASWRERAARGMAAYRYTGMGVEPAGGGADAEAWEAAVEREGPVAAPGQGEDGRRLVAPIRLRGQTIGSVVFGQDPEREPWSPDDTALVEEVSAQIALALENARLLEETRQRAEREQTLGQMTARFTRSLDVDALLKGAVRELGRVLQMDEVAVYLGAPATDRAEEAGHS